jgi:DNA-binding Xre family transcriptional regulator
VEAVKPDRFRGDRPQRSSLQAICVALGCQVGDLLVQGPDASA